MFYKLPELVYIIMVTHFLIDYYIVDQIEDYGRWGGMYLDHNTFIF